MRRLDKNARAVARVRFAAASAPVVPQSPTAFGHVSAPIQTPPIDPTQTPLDFVCEEDVRVALDAGRTLLVSERAIITPSARELGEARRVFTFAPHRG